VPSGGNPTWFKSGREVNLADGNIQAIIFGNADDGSRFMVDCAVEISGKAI